MDRSNGRKNVSDLAVTITFLAPFLVYAFIEYLICCLWNLFFRSLHGLCCLLLHGLQKNLKDDELTRHELAEYHSPDKAPSTCQLHQETNYSFQQNKRTGATDICEPAESTDFSKDGEIYSSAESTNYSAEKRFHKYAESTERPGYFKKTSEKKETRSVKGKIQDKQSFEKVKKEQEISFKRSFRLARKQRITKYIIHDTKPDEGILHESSTTSYRINCQNNETESDVHDSKARIAKVDSNDQRFPCTRKENEQESGKRKIFDDNFLDESKTGRNREVLSEKRKEKKDEICNRSKGNEKALEQLNNPTRRASKKPEDKSHLTAVITTADNDTQAPPITLQAVNRSNFKGLLEEGKEDHELGTQQQLVKTSLTTDSPQGEENHTWVINSFKKKVTSGVKEEERTQLDVKGFCCNFVNYKSLPNDSETRRVSSLARVANMAQSLNAATSDSATAATASEEGITQTESSTSSLITFPAVIQHENETLALSLNVDLPCPNVNFVDINPMRETAKKCHASYLFETKNNDQNSVTTTNFRRPKLRTEQVKRSRIPFPRVSLALKYKKTPWL